MTIPDQSYFPFMSGDETMDLLARQIRQTVLEYVEKSRLQSLVLGISGGIDSALCAALLQPVCEQLHIPLIGRSITIETNKEDEIQRSIAVGRAFCHDFEHLDITGTFLENKKLLVQFDDSHLSKLRQGNMKARMRMMVLFDLAQLHRGMVISTDNYLLREENEAQRAALQSCIDATPVDGLGISQSDCEQLGVPNYFEADKVFAAFFQGDESLRDHVLIQRYFASEYKRQNPMGISRAILMQE